MASMEQALHKVIEQVRNLSVATGQIQQHQRFQEQQQQESIQQQQQQQQLQRQHFQDQQQQLQQKLQQQQQQSLQQQQQQQLQQQIQQQLQQQDNARRESTPPNIDMATSSKAASFVEDNEPFYEVTKENAKKHSPPKNNGKNKTKE